MIESLVALRLTDESGYAEYRRRMTPLLRAAGGSFGYDFKVAELLIAPSDEPVNRVFTIRFPSPEAQEAFFSNPDYLAIRREHFDPSVAYVDRVGTWEIDPSAES